MRDAGVGVDDEENEGSEASEPFVLLPSDSDSESDGSVGLDALSDLESEIDSPTDGMQPVAQPLTDGMQPVAQSTPCRRRTLFCQPDPAALGPQNIQPDPAVLAFQNIQDLSGIHPLELEVLGT